MLAVLGRSLEMTAGRTAWCAVKHVQRRRTRLDARLRPSVPLDRKKPLMSYTNDQLDLVRAQIAPYDTVLAAARTRLGDVRGLASTFPGALRTYASGSLAHGTVNHPVSDGDGGLVLDRRSYPNLGPDGGGEQPRDVVADLCALLGPTLREIYPNAKCGTSKRGPKVWFGAPIEGQDPTVDLVVALTRQSGGGLWIPNLERNIWEASDPETHTALITGGTASLAQTRRRIIRLAKAWNKQFTSPAFSSFHLSALALESVTAGLGVAHGLHATFDDAATSLAVGNTPDPAGVSAPIKLLTDRATAVRRLRKAADNLAEALAAEDDEVAVTAALSRVFWKYIDAPDTPQLTAAVAAMTQNKTITTATLGLAGPAVALAPTRAYGDRRP